MRCDLCQNSDRNKVHVVREAHSATAERFPHLECAARGCLRLIAGPVALSAYYPLGYHSLVARPRAGWPPSWSLSMNARSSIAAAGPVPSQAWTPARRHCYTHSRASLEILGASAGLRVERVPHDSTVSEQARRGVPLHADGSFAQDPLRPDNELGGLLRQAARTRRLNHEQRGDQAAFSLVAIA